MMLFWGLAAALLIGAAGFILWPLLRARDGSRDAGPGMLIAALIVVAGGTLYWLLGNHNWPLAVPPGADAIEKALSVADDQPASIDAQLELAQAYVKGEQYSLGLRAFERANQLAAGQSAAALAGMGEVILLQTPDSNPAGVQRASELLEQSLKLDPLNAKALFYAGAIAMRSGNLQGARDHFATMLTLDVPTNVHAALAKQVAALDAQLQPPPVDGATALHLHVTVNPAIASRVAPDTQLFVFVRSPQGGPPLAVRRLSGDLPADVVLSARDSMIAGSEIKPGQAVLVVARLSRSGAPVAQSGDFFGELKMKAGQKGAGDLVIDQVTP